MPISRIHSTAIIAPGAKLANNVEVGPYAIIEDYVEIGFGTKIGAHTVIQSHVKIGEHNAIHPHVVIGGIPQDISFKNEKTWVEVGNYNTIREFATIHRATGENQATRVGSRCFLMAYSHIAHDCQIQDEVTLVNGVNLGGHVLVGRKAMLGGMSQVHQFTRIGAYTMVASGVMVRKDVLPFTMLGGEPLRHYRLNSIGLKRAGITDERYKILETAYRRLRQGDKNLSGLEQTPEIKLLETWLAEKSLRGLSGFLK